MGVRMGKRSAASFESFLLAVLSVLERNSLASSVGVLGLISHLFLCARTGLGRRHTWAPSTGPSLGSACSPQTWSCASVSCSTPPREPRALSVPRAQTVCVFVTEGPG